MNIENSGIYYVSYTTLFRSRGPPHRDDLRVAGRVRRAFPVVASRADDLAGRVEDDRPDRDLSLLERPARLGQRQPHRRDEALRHRVLGGLISHWSGHVLGRSAFLSGGPAGPRPAAGDPAPVRSGSVRSVSVRSVTEAVELLAET